MSQLNHFVPTIKHDVARLQYRARDLIVSIDANSLELNPDSGVDGPEQDDDEMLCKVRRNFQSAVLLARYNPLLEHLEGALAENLNWYPDESVAAAVELTLFDRNDPSRKIGISLNSSSADVRHARLLCINNSANDSVGVQQHFVQHKVCLSELPLSFEDLDRLKPGSYVLLANTFRSDFTIKLVNDTAVSSEARNNTLSASVSRSSLRIKPSEMAQPEHLHAATTSSLQNNTKSAVGGVGSQSAEQPCPISVCVWLELPVTVDVTRWQSVPSDQQQSEQTRADPAASLPGLIGQRVWLQTVNSESAPTKENVTDRNRLHGQLVDVADGLAVLLDKQH